MSSNARLPVFQERFRLLMGEMSQTEFAEFIGISRQSVGFYLNGNRIPDAKGIYELSEKCNVSSDWLLGLSQINSRNETIKGVNAYTGLSQEAIKKLKVFADASFSKDEIAHQQGTQYCDFFSYLASNLELLGTLRYFAKIQNIRDYGLCKTDESIFDDDEAAINYYTYAATNALFRIISEFFSDYK